MSRALAAFLDERRAAKDLSFAEVHRRLTRRGVQLSDEAVRLYFRSVVPPVGTLALLADVLGLSVRDRARALDLAAEDALAAAA